MALSVETIKKASRHLRGTLYDDVYCSLEPGVSEESRQLLKFFGMYLQDDRDVRRARSDQGLERDFRFMVRIALALGQLSADQYLAIDQLATTVGAGQVRLTSRQAIQLHGIHKGQLAPLVDTLHEVGVTTLAGCGDVERNVMACAAPDRGIRDQVAEIAFNVARHLRPKTGAYLELFVEGERVYDIREEEPLYGETYLPRKFKTGFAIAGDNCTDVYSNDLGVVAQSDERGKLDRLTILVGGGLGHSHGVARTQPFVAKVLGDIHPHNLVAVVEAIITIQRDYGNREDRRFARMKYLVDSWGIQKFREMVEQRSHIIFTPSLPLTWTDPQDHLGWHLEEGQQGYLGLHIGQGRIQDTPEHSMRSALRAIMTQFRPNLRITPQQNLLLLNLSVDQKERILAIWKDAQLGNPDELPSIRRLGMACVALPTCGLALAEAERVFPKLLRELEANWVRLGLANEPLAVRMTGCPNNCVRTEMAEVGFVGASPGKYHVYLGGNREGSRLGQKFLERVPFDQLAETVVPLMDRYAKERQSQQPFGDWCVSIGLESLRRDIEEVKSWTLLSMNFDKLEKR